MTVEVRLYRILSIEGPDCAQPLKSGVGVSKNRRSQDAFDSFDAARCADVNMPEPVKNDGHHSSWYDKPNVHDGNQDHDSEKLEYKLKKEILIINFPVNAFLKNLRKCTRKEFEAVDCRCFQCLSRSDSRFFQTDFD